MARIIDYSRRLLQEPFLIDGLHRWKWGSDDSLSGFTNPLESLLGVHGRRPVPDSDGECEDTLNHYPIEFGQDRGGHSETPLASEKTNPPLALLHAVIDIRSPAQIIRKIDTENLNDSTITTSDPFIIIG